MIEINTTLSLYAGESFIRVKHSLINTACDHRLRTVWRTSLKTPDSSFADSGFSLIKHPVMDPELNDWQAKGYVEAPVPIYNMENLVVIKDPHSAVGFIVAGCKEYEVLADANLALTLFRSVGILGRDNLVWRPNRASGINNTVVETPDAQLLGPLEFEYAVWLSHDFTPSQAFTQVENYLSHLSYYQLQTLNTLEQRIDRFMIPQQLAPLPNQLSLFNLTNPKLLVSTLKLANKSGTLILRIFNPENRCECTHLAGTMLEELYLSNLSEELNIPLRLDQEIVVAAKGYQTLKIKLKSAYDSWD